MKFLSTNDFNALDRLDDAKKVIELNPNLWQPYMIRVTCYQQLGYNAKAQSDFAKAKKFGYND